MESPRLRVALRNSKNKNNNNNNLFTRKTCQHPNHLVNSESTIGFKNLGYDQAKKLLDLKKIDNSIVLVKSGEYLCNVCYEKVIDLLEMTHENESQISKKSEVKKSKLNQSAETDSRLSAENNIKMTIKNNLEEDHINQIGTDEAYQKKTKEEMNSQSTKSIANGQMASQEERKIAGRFRQCIIMFWKNSLLFRRNVWGTLAELLMAFLFCLIILLLRFFIDLTVFPDQSSVNTTSTSILSYNPVLSPFNLVNSSNRTQIYYYPNNSFILGLVTNAYTLINAVKPSFNATLVGSNVSDTSQLTATEFSNMIAFISFSSTYTSSASIPTSISYTIYTEEQAAFQYNIAKLFHDLVDYLYTNSPEYYCFLQTYFRLYRTLFTPIKHAIDLSLISAVANVNLTNPYQVTISQLNCPGYNNDIFKTRFAFFLSILIQFSFVFSLVVNLGYIVVEKQSKMKEYLKLLGVKWYILWITWYIRVFVPYLILSIIITIFGVIKMKPRQSGSDFGQKATFQYTSAVVVFSVMFVYSVQVAMFIILLGQLFSKPFVAKIVGILIWIVTAINFFSNPSPGTIYFLSLFPNIAFQFIIQVLFQYERSGVTLNYSNLYTNLYGNGINVGGILAVQLAWTLIYIPIAWYIERIFPGDYGAPQPFYFPFMPSYWSNKKNDMISDVEMKNVETNKFGFEKDPSDLKTSISIQNITKKFRLFFKEKTVVDNMSINFYENQITGLLGHNGAGKTTTTFMLCGIYAPDAGTAYILGNNILTQMNKIQTSLGFCPQHDILYDDLTVAEHIDLVASIKGFKKQQIKEEINSISKLVGLDNHLEKKSKELSGGMKRRLSVAMALTGGSKVIILDEPTSGLDPFNRRGLWELIRKFKKGRSIVLTTHFMEEADALSDRIAIMNHGQVKCCGTPIFLKNSFGSGYRLTLAKNAGTFNETGFRELLSSNLSKYTIESNIAAELTVSIPFTSNSLLPTLFTKIEESRNALGIDGYGISSPTIEEVFIKVGSIDLQTSKEDENLPAEKLDNENLSNVFAAEFTRNSGIILILQQIKSLIVKRAQIFIRRFILGTFILFFPFVLQGALAGIIPGQTTLINSLRGIVSVLGTQNFASTVTNYGSQTVPYYMTGLVSTTGLNSILTNMYSSSRPNVNLVSLSSGNNDTNAYVLNLRKTNRTAFLYDYFYGMNFNLINSSLLTATGFYSTLAYHSPGVVLNEINNVLLKYYTNNNAYTLTTINSPLSASSSLSNSTSFLDVLACIDSFPVSLLNFIVSVIVAFIISILVMHMARERLNGSKQLQLLSGVHYSTYWFANYLFDMTICLINISSMVFIIKIVALSKNDPTSEVDAVVSNSLGYYFLILLFSSFTWCSMAYFWSFFFKSDIIGFVVLFILLGVISFIDVILTFVQLLFQTSVAVGEDAPGANAIFVIRNIIAFFLPNVVVKRALYDMKVRENDFCIAQVKKYLNLNFESNANPVSVNEPGIGLWLIYSVLQFILFNFLIYLLEARPWSNIDLRKSCRKVDNKEISTYDNIEEDVKQEAIRIRNCDLKVKSASEPLLVSQLLKVFRNGKKEYKAVNMLSFGISPKECFGLLGLNGAGKTTTFKILTGELKATEGTAYINGYNINTQKSKARRNLGFCPQFDYLPEYMSVEETFNLFAELRGLERNKIEKIIQDLIKIFNLNEFTKKLVQNLSGGNKRKVSAAIAFIGRPSVVILDEPTTGMDPAARRYLWTVIKRAVDMGMTVVLTTHSMEESEALSSRLGIMVNGQFKCLGSVQHLKNKFGKGYSLILKCKHTNNINEDVAKVEEFVMTNIRHSKMKDKQQETLFYQIEDSENNTSKDLQSIAELFTLIENNKDALLLETYSLSQTSLEQVFLSFAKEQKNEEETNKKNN